MEYLWLFIAFLLILAGNAGVLIPFLPGIPLIYAAYLVWGIASGWRDYGATTMVVLGVVTLLSYAVDYFAGAVGAKKYGASPLGVWGSIIGGIVGFVFFSVPGLILGPFAGAIAGEMLAGKRQQEAWRAGWGAFLGFLAGSVFKIALAILMTGLFIFYLIF
ncbi:MAG: DUF456 domain-containing protein [Calditrichaeota bacterium]|nr:MAG: DUF456 domain-containing protein [Calditrichota bacterium]